MNRIIFFWQLKVATERLYPISILYCRSEQPCHFCRAWISLLASDWILCWIQIERCIRVVPPLPSWCCSHISRYSDPEWQEFGGNDFNLRFVSVYSWSIVVLLPQAWIGPSTTWKVQLELPLPNRHKTIHPFSPKCQLWFSQHEGSPRNLASSLRLSAWKFQRVQSTKLFLF